MPIGIQQFRALDSDEVSPFGGVLAKSIALRLAQANAEKAEKEMPYAGLAAYSNARAKNAYANAVNPQFLAKLMENKDLLPGIKDPQAKLDYLTSIGLGGQSNTTSDPFNAKLVDILKNQHSHENPLSALGKSIAGIFGGQQTSTPSNSQPTQKPYQQPVQQPLSSPVNTQQNNQTVTPNAQNYNVSSPTQSADEGIVSVNQGNYDPNDTNHNNKFFENIAEKRKVIGKGETAGKEEGKQQAEYGPTYASLQDQGNVIEAIQKDYQNPVLERLVNTPFVNQKAISWYKNSGTKEEKQALAKVEADQNKLINASIKDFGSRMTDRDLTLLQATKPSDKDTLDVRRGKLESLKILNQVNKQKIELAHDFMKNNNMDKFEAEAAANKSIDMDAIEERVHNQINPPPVQVMTPNGIVELPQRGAEQLVRDHGNKGYRIVS